MDAIETFEHQGHTIEIHHDECGESPREWDNCGMFCAWHRRYSLGDKNAPKDFETMLHELIELVEDAEKQDAIRDLPYSDMLDVICQEVPKLVILPVYIYEHGGITLNTTGFSCPWDSGQLGFIYLVPRKVDEEFGGDVEKAKKILVAEIKDMDDYVTGQVYGYRIDPDTENEDSCWGFYGDIEYVREEAKFMAERMNKHAQAT
jgi:hypothetical protein